MSFSWILVLAAIVYFSRLIFLLPSVPIKLSEKFKHFLSYASPSVLAGITTPIIFIHDDKLNLNPTNPFLIASIFAILLAYFTKNIILTCVLSMGLLLILKQFI